MENIISKELLSEVLYDGKYNLEVSEVMSDNTTILVEDKIEISEFINIHELAHKCKEWAIGLGFGIMTSENKDGVSVKLFGPYGLVNEFLPIDTKKYVFNYCQWILDSGFYIKNLKE